VKRNALIILSAAVFAFIIGAPTIRAETYPNRPIQLILPQPPGSALDTTGRLIADEMGKILGVQVMAINKPGAAATLGTDQAAKSRKDGYTLVYTNTSAMVYTRVHHPETVSYDPVKDFEPIGLHLFFPLVGSVQESAPWKTFSDLVEDAKKNPEKIRVGTSGQGSIDHFNLEIIQSLTGAKFNMIPFKAGQALIPALLGGHVEVTFDAFSQVLPHAGKLKMLLISKKMPDYPIPLITDLGYKQGLLSAWYALFAPAGIPDEARVILTQAFEKAVKNPPLRAKVEKLGFAVDYKPPQEVKELIVNDYERALAIATKIGLRK
jgi:tripartite-type tricarboxylate transporter receptor subunit TctC